MEYNLSKYLNLRNSNSVWVGMDCKGVWEKNCKDYPNSKTLKYYKENPIEYSFNNYGFRTPDDFNDTDEGNVFLGCSQTIGIGHHLKNTWSYKINKEIGGKSWNLSQGGTGIQTDYRLLYAWKDTLKIKNIFHYTVPWPRYEFFNEVDNEMEFIYLDHHKEKHDTNWGHKSYRWEFFVDVLAAEEYCSYNQKVYINAIKGLSQEIGCNYYYLTPAILGWPAPSHATQKLDENDTSLCARDLGHYTVGRMNFLYEKFLKLWEKDNGL